MIHRRRLDVGNFALVPYLTVQSQVHILKQRYKGPIVIFFAHRRFLPPIDFHPNDTGGNRENVTLLRPTFITQRTKVHFGTLLSAYCWAAFTLRGERG